MAKDAVKKPDYTLSYLDKATGAKGTIGAGWSNSKGYISIKLNPCVVVSSNPDVVLTLFPVKTEAGTQTTFTAYDNNDQEALF